MPFEQHQEKNYPLQPQAVFQAALKSTQKLGGKFIASDLDQCTMTVRFPKTILGQTLGDRTELSCRVTPLEGGALLVVDAFPLDAVERKLMFGARKGVTLTVVTWFIAHLENFLGLLEKK